MDSAYFFEGTTYLSPGDEDAHFEWLAKIGCVRAVRGAGRRLFLDVDVQAVTDPDLRELNAVYRRYGGDPAQLEGLAVVSKENLHAAVEGKRGHPE